MKTWEKIIVIGFVILNSISGLQISGISVNAVFVGLFTVFAGVEFLKHKNKGGMKIPRASGFLLFILCSMVSCLFSMAYDFRVEHYDIVKSYLINSTFYLVIFVLLFNCTNKYLSECTDCYVNGIVWAARIQAIWGILQLILQYGAGININQILFVDILHSTNTRDWIMGFFSGNSWNMRITGLNFENSMFALVVCLGAALEKKKVWKFLLLATAVLSLSRTGWVILIALNWIAGMNYRRFAQLCRMWPFRSFHYKMTNILWYFIFNEDCTNHILQKNQKDSFIST